MTDLIARLEAATEGSLVDWCVNCERVVVHSSSDDKCIPNMIILNSGNIECPYRQLQRGTLLDAIAMLRARESETANDHGRG